MQNYSPKVVTYFTENLKPYLPIESVDLCVSLILKYDIHLKITNRRTTKLGDYRIPMKGEGHKISINHNLNKYTFLITLLHEIAHLITFEKYGRKVAPHGQEWKNEFATLLIESVKRGSYPADLKPYITRHCKSPKASYGADIHLTSALKKYDNVKAVVSLVKDIPIGQKFKVASGKVFEKVNLRRTKYLCKEVSSGKMYLVPALMEVTPI